MKTGTLAKYPISSVRVSNSKSLVQYLISLSTVDCIVAASHYGVDADTSIKGSSGQDSRVSGAPLDIKAPLRASGQLIQNLVKRFDRIENNTKRGSSRKTKNLNSFKILSSAQSNVFYNVTLF